MSNSQISLKDFYDFMENYSYSLIKLDFKNEEIDLEKINETSNLALIPSIS
jgi:hypothetical protein